MVLCKQYVYCGFDISVLVHIIHHDKFYLRIFFYQFVYSENPLFAYSHLYMWELLLYHCRLIAYMLGISLFWCSQHITLCFPPVSAAQQRTLVFSSQYLKQMLYMGRFSAAAGRKVSDSDSGDFRNLLFQNACGKGNVAYNHDDGIPHRDREAQPGYYFSS